MSPKRDYPYPNFGAALWPGDVFADGTRKEDVQAALQAAWLADNIPLCVEIAMRYGVLGRVCLRCAIGGVPGITPDTKRPDTLLFHLCEVCSENELRSARPLIAGFAGAGIVSDAVAGIRDAQEVINAAHPDKSALAVDGYLGPRTLARLWGKG